MTEVAACRPPARSETGDPLLLTPGPLTTSKSVKQAMLHDWGSRDAAFVALNREVMERLPEIVHGEGRYVTVPMQGSGTFAVEAMLTTFAPKDGLVLVLINGAYGQRAKPNSRDRRTQGHRARDVRGHAARPLHVERILATTPAITHVFAVHCETTSGILNPIDDIAAIVARHGKRLLIDAMSAFGALPLDARKSPFDAVAASANKCLEGVPGLGFVICRREALAETEGRATTLTLDLFDQTRTSKRPASFASRLRSMSSSPFIRRLRSFGPKAASPAAAVAIPATRGC